MKKVLSIMLATMLCLSMASLAMADTYGLGIATGIGSSKSASTKDGETYDGKGQVDSTVCAVALDDNGVITSISFDVAQTSIAFTVEGEVTTDLTAEVKSKVELGEDYGMRAASPIGKELFEQLAAFEEYCIGKPAAEIIGMPTVARDDNHPSVPDVPDLATSCTIDVGSMLKALEKAVANAK